MNIQVTSKKQLNILNNRYFVVSAELEGVLMIERSQAEVCVYNGLHVIILC